jgi:hypothetical protein
MRLKANGDLHDGGIAWRLIAESNEAATPDELEGAPGVVANPP